MSVTPQDIFGLEFASQRKSVLQPEDFVDIKTVSTGELKQHMMQGWVVIIAGTKKDDVDQTNAVYIVGLPKEEKRFPLIF